MFWEWLGTNWVPLIETGSLVFAIFAIYDNTKARRLSNLLRLTQSHRELWSEPIRRPALARILDSTRNLSQDPLSTEEEEFLNLAILHVRACFQAIRDGMPIHAAGVEADVRAFFSLPAVQSVWNRRKPFYEKQFIAWIEDHKSGDSETSAVAKG
jgi:hypothetical protein